MPYCTHCGTPETPGQQFCPNCGQPAGGGAEETTALPYFPMDKPVSAPPELASFWWRALGYIVDSVILAIVVTLPLRGMKVNAYAESVIYAAVVFVYGVLLLTRLDGQTIGMRVVRVRVVDAATRAPVAMTAALQRTALFCVIDLVGSLYHYTRYAHPTAAQKVTEAHHLLIALVLILPLVVDLLWPLWDKQNQTLHDKFAHTLVLRPVTTG